MLGRSGETNYLAEDLGFILSHTAGVWEELRNQRIFITGGTGFFGCWLLESFAWANDELRLGASATVLTRDVDAFHRKAPHLSSHPAIDFHVGDVRWFEFPRGTFSHVIHAATDSSAGLNERDPASMLDTIISGTRHTLDFAVACGATRFLLTSSGTVYGKQPTALTHVPENYSGAPDAMDPRSAYAEGKRTAELICAIYHKRYGIETKIARCFAFLGPYLPLGAHFAIGNFIADRLRGSPIRVTGDGTPYRSYLYAADLTVWLWTILIRGAPCRPYNVGSGTAMTIAQVAQEVSRSGPPVPVHIALAADPRSLPDRYVPSVSRAEEELCLEERIPLRQAIARTLAWHRRRNPQCDKNKGFIHESC